MSFREDLQHGLEHTTRYRQGEGINVWGAELLRLAGLLERQPLTLEVAALLHQLFEEIGQQIHDLNEIAARR
jgi:hypothetical protein